MKFSVELPWRPAGPVPVPVSSGQRFTWIVMQTVFVLALAGGGYVAFRNLREGRGDLKGAARLAACTFAGLLIARLMTAHHTARFLELYILVSALSWAAFGAGLLWVLYVAVEPHMRRRQPEGLVTWARLLSGTLRDRLVASHILAGVAIALCAGTIVTVAMYSVGVVGLRSPVPLSGPRFLVADVLNQTAVAALASLMAAFFRTALISTVRVSWLADGILFAILLVTSPSFQLLDSWQFVVVGLVGSSLLVLILRYFGLLTFFVYMQQYMTANRALEVPPFSAWYSSQALAVQLLVAAFCGWLLYVVVGGRDRRHA